MDDNRVPSTNGIGDEPTPTHIVRSRIKIFTGVDRKKVEDDYAKWADSPQKKYVHSAHLSVHDDYTIHFVVMYDVAVPITEEEEINAPH